jgi:hypothetical protein
MKTKVVKCPHCGNDKRTQGVSAPMFSMSHGGVEWLVACLNPDCHKEFIVHFEQYKVTKTSKTWELNN